MSRPEPPDADPSSTVLDRVHRLVDACALDPSPMFIPLARAPSAADLSGAAPDAGGAAKTSRPPVHPPSAFLLSRLGGTWA
ncbi:MAG: hypothetical protein JNM07_07335 [Phycisphaerae bacterium]|nr:hypothetical protein [Phycisphaerae bacterium]